MQEEEERIARKMKQLQERQERKKERKAKGKGATTATTPVQEAPKPIQAGETVKLKGQTTVGQVMEVSGKQAVVIFGQLKTVVKLDRLERTNAPLRATDLSTKSTFVSTETRDAMYEKKLNFKQDVDVRGMRGDEALQAVMHFIDDAILVYVQQVRILHGKGNGILRQLVRQYLSSVPNVIRYHDEDIRFGGTGITVAEF